MLIDFMKSCTPVLDSEIEDYNLHLWELAHNKDAFTAFMPAIIEDFWPISIMETTGAKKYNHHSGNSIYIIPYGAHDFWGVRGLNDILRKWYYDDEIAIGEECGLEVRETILLKSGDIQYSITIDLNDISANAVYLEVLTESGDSIHILILIEKSNLVWKSIIEKYTISIDLLIDSHKGIGAWFDEEGNLYKTMTSTLQSTLLPQYYFKGKYISHDAPNAFEKEYIIPEAEGKHWCECAIYKTNWK